MTDLRELLLARERTAPVGAIDVEGVTARTVRGRRRRLTSQVTLAAAACAVAVVVTAAALGGHLPTPGPALPAATEPVATDGPTADPVAATALLRCGDPVPDVAAASSGLSAVVVPDLGGPTAGQVPVTLVLRNAAASTFTAQMPGPTYYLAQDGRIVGVAATGEPRPVEIAPGAQDVVVGAAIAADCAQRPLPDGGYSVYASVTLAPSTGPELTFFTGGLTVALVDGTPRPDLPAPDDTIGVVTTDALDGPDPRTDVTTVWQAPGAAGDTLTVLVCVVAYDASTGTPVAISAPTVGTVVAPDDRIEISVPLAARHMNDLVTGDPVGAGERSVRVVVSGYVVGTDGRARVVGSHDTLRTVALG